MAAFFFILAFIAQLIVGVPLTPLCAFWYIVFADTTASFMLQGVQSLFWAFITGISLGIIGGPMGHWIIIMVFVGLVLFVLRNFVFLTLNHITLSLLLAVMVGIMAIFHSPLTLPLALMYYFFYAFIFFITLAVGGRQKNHSRRLH